MSCFIFLVVVSNPPDHVQVGAILYAERSIPIRSVMPSKDKKEEKRFVLFILLLHLQLVHPNRSKRPHHLVQSHHHQEANNRIITSDGDQNRIYEIVGEWSKPE